MFTITLTRIETAEQVIQYPSWFGLSDGAIADLAAVGLAVTMSSG